MNKMHDLNAEAFARLAADPERGPIAMLNLLKFKPDGGAERFAQYAAAALPLVEKSGGRTLYAGACGELVIGKEDWDLMALVEYPTAGTFTSMILSDAYQAVVHMRQEAIVRSVLYETQPAALAGPTQ